MNSKLHYARYGRKMLCGFAETAIADSSERARDFFASKKEHRCWTCEKLLRKSGMDFNKFVKLYGGEV